MTNIIFIILLIFSISLQAQDGITQTHLLSTTPTAESIGVDPNTPVTIRFDSEVIETTPLAELLTVRDNADAMVSGTLLLSNDKKSLVFTPESALVKGTHSVALGTLSLQGNEQSPCKGFWNAINVHMCKSFSLRCDDICYEEVSIQTEPITYTFSVADAMTEITGLSIELRSQDLNVSETMPVIVKAHYKDNTTEDITTAISWASSDDAVVKVEASHLIAGKEGSAQIVATYNNAISTSVLINVYKVIDNHRLPPEPDMVLNNATLLGIDVNHNGVRDDVERWIYLDMEIQNGYPKIERAIGMQGAKAFQMTLVDPTNKDDKVHMAVAASRNCWVWYDYSRQSHQYGALGRSRRALKDKTFNTRERFKTYWEYDSTLGGRVFTLKPTLQTHSDCETDIDAL